MSWISWRSAWGYVGVCCRKQEHLHRHDLKIFLGRYEHSCKDSATLLWGETGSERGLSACSSAFLSLGLITPVYTAKIRMIEKRGKVSRSEVKGWCCDLVRVPGSLWTTPYARGPRGSEPVLRRVPCACFSDAGWLSGLCQASPLNCCFPLSSPFLSGFSCHHISAVCHWPSGLSVSSSSSVAVGISRPTEDISNTSTFAYKMTSAVPCRMWLKQMVHVLDETSAP